MKRSLRVAALSALVFALAACSTFRDRSADYQTAENAPLLQFPAGSEARPLRDLYPIPAISSQTKLSGKFEVPAPKPLLVAQPGAAEPLGKEQANAQLTLGQDGNGYPTLQAQGGFSQIWDKLDQALKAADVKIDDRNQSLGLYFLRLPNAESKLDSYQLRVTRGVNAYALSLQKDDDTLASPALTKTLFEKIQAKWP